MSMGLHTAELYSKVGLTSETYAAIFVSFVQEPRLRLTKPRVLLAKAVSLFMCVCSISDLFEFLPPGRSVSLSLVEWHFLICIQL